MLKVVFLKCLRSVPLATNSKLLSSKIPFEVVKVRVHFFNVPEPGYVILIPFISY